MAVHDPQKGMHFRWPWFLGKYFVNPVSEILCNYDIRNRYIIVFDEIEAFHFNKSEYILKTNSRQNG